MPRFLASAALVFSLVCVATSDAQQAVTTSGKSLVPAGTAASSFNGVDPRKLTFTPVNTTGAMHTLNTTNIVRTTNTAQQPSTLSKFFHGFSLPSWPPKPATTSILPQKSNPFQPTLPKGQYTFPPAASQK